MPSLTSPAKDERADVERGQILAFLDEKMPSDEQMKWTFSIVPQRFKERFADRNAMDEKLIRIAVRRGGHEFPVRRDCHPMKWGIANDHSFHIWGLSRNGVFVSREPLYESNHAYTSPWENPHGGRKVVSPNRWIEYEMNLERVVRYFVFLSRYSTVFEKGEKLNTELRIEPIKSRVIATTNPRINLGLFDGQSGECRENVFEYSKALLAEECASAWKVTCADLLFEFFGYFPHLDMRRDVLEKWVERLGTTGN